MSAPILRPYQLEAIAQVADHMRAGHKRVLLVSPTGSGKTVIAADIIRRLRASGMRCLFLAHARQLIYQASEKLASIDVGHGVIMAGERPRASDVQVASIHSLKRRTLPPADLVLIDEADLARAKTYDEILNHYRGAFVVGMTASPWRGDGKGLGGPDGLFSESVLVATPKQLIEQGFLVQYDPFVFESVDTKGIKANQEGDFSESELAKRTLSAEGRRLSVDSVVSEYLARTPGRRGVAFAVSVEHSKLLVEAFRAKGVPAEHVDATVPQADRTTMFGRARRGETLVLSTVGILTRGVDIPALEVAMLARPTKSVSLFLQMVGRVMRPSRDTGKERAVIHDHAGCMMRGNERVHGLPDEDRDYSLTGDGNVLASAGAKAPVVVRCLNCYMPVSGGPENCPRCGATLAEEQKKLQIDTRPVRAIEPETVRAVLEHAAVADPRAEQVYLNAQALKAAQSDYQPGWVKHRFKNRYGRWPTGAQILEATQFAKREMEKIAAMGSAQARFAHA